MSAGYLSNVLDDVLLNAKAFTYNQKKGALNIEELVTELVETVEELSGKFEEIVIYGHSFGGILALEASDKLSSKVTTIVLDPPIINSNYINHMKISNTEKEKIASIHSSKLNLNIKYEKMTEALSSSYFSNPNLMDNFIEKTQFDGTSKEAIQVSYLNNFTLFQKIKDYKNTIKFINGGRDKIVPPDYVEELLEELDMKSYTISNSGHFPLIEARGEVVSFLNTIL
tara:strand:+ start:90658 stop:91338 length:681 start_codon:yes stop_codon:yes gene_type:complete